MRSTNLVLCREVGHRPDDVPRIVDPCGFIYFYDYKGHGDDVLIFHVTDPVRHVRRAARPSSDRYSSGRSERSNAENRQHRSFWNRADPRPARASGPTRGVRLHVPQLGIYDFQIEVDGQHLATASLPIVDK